MIHFLEANGVPATIVKWATVALLGWLVKLVRAHVHVQRQIRDELDTSKPGGLTDVVAALEKKKPVPKPRAKPAAKDAPKPQREGEGRA